MASFGKIRIKISIKLQVVDFKQHMKLLKMFGTKNKLKKCFGYLPPPTQNGTQNKKKLFQTTAIFNGIALGLILIYNYASGLFIRTVISYNVFFVPFI